MTAYVIETQGLTKVYDGVVGLEDLDLQVPEHSIFGFLGPNGAGKTTTMKLLLNLIKPTRGGGTVFGQDIVRESVEIRSRVGYLPQDPRFYEHMTARETLDFTAKFFFKGPQNEIDQRVEEMLDLVGLAGIADRPVGGFSGGERQRLGIAQAQVNYPDLLILDEPAASLDPLGRRDVLDVMARLRKHTTIFYSTHILDDVQRVSDTVAILNHGRLVTSGPIESLLAGSGGVVYTVAFRGDVDGARARLADRSWIDEIRHLPTAAGDEANGVTRWSVAVTDPEIAEAELLRALLADPDLVVTDFRRRSYELEDIFVQLVEGGDDGGE
ncbi:MAG: ABC transporter ATP-binding protein [Anaerolineae bacterium]